jgi:ATP/maltotriose-dependent transcriptional regulator MalT
MTLKDFNLTIEDAIMLHLLDYTKFQGEFEVPYEITQPGIADAVGIRRSHAANVIKSLKDKVQVEERTAHVKNIPRKRKSYFLTDSGKEYIIDLRNNLAEKMVKLKGNKNEINDLKLSEINQTYSTHITLLQLVRLIRPDNSVELGSILDFKNRSEQEESRDRIDRGLVNFTGSMVCPSRFLGRDEEIIKIINWLDNELPRIIVITGIPGIGKTSLAAKVIDQVKNNKSSNLFWYRFHEWDKLRSILRSLSEFLNQLDRNKLKFYIDNHSKIDLSEVMNILESDLQNLDTVLIFDDLQKISQNLLQIFSLLVEILDSDKYSEIKIIILSRDKINFYDRRKVVINNLITELELQGLDSNACNELLDQPFKKNIDLEKIYDVTQGHPFTLELINLHLTSQPDKIISKFNVDEFVKDHQDLNRYLQEEILHNLTDLEKKVLDLISVFRYPILPEALLSETGIEHENIDSLTVKSLIKLTTTGYEVHELIKDFFYRRLNHISKAKYHIVAAEYYKSIIEKADIQPLTNAMIEAQYHYIRGGDFGLASKLIDKYGDELINKGYSDELDSTIMELEPDKIPEEIWAKILIHRGHISTINGNWDDALECYQDSLKICEKINDCQGLSRAYNGSGVIYFHKGDWKTAMELYKKGLEFAETENDNQNSSKLYSNISLIHWGNGELDQAQELMRKSLFISEKMDDHQGIARAYNNLGIIFWEQGEFDEAIIAYKKSLKLSEEMGDKQTIAILYNNIGETYRMKDMGKLAEEFYMKSLNLAQELGFKWQVGQVCCNLGELYRRSDKVKSMEFLNRSYDIYRDLGAKREVQKVRDLIASL